MRGVSVTSPVLIFTVTACVPAVTHRNQHQPSAGNFPIFFWEF